MGHLLRQFSLSGSATARLRPRGLLNPLSVLIEPVTTIPCLKVHLHLTSALPRPGEMAEEDTRRKKPHPPSKDFSSTGLSSDEPKSPRTFPPSCTSLKPAPPSPGQSKMKRRRLLLQLPAEFLRANVHVHLVDIRRTIGPDYRLEAKLYLHARLRAAKQRETQCPGLVQSRFWLRGTVRSRRLRPMILDSTRCPHRQKVSAPVSTNFASLPLSANSAATSVIGASWPFPSNGKYPDSS